MNTPFLPSKVSQFPRIPTNFRKDAMAVGSYEPVNDQERFGMEYWSLEQVKLGKAQPPTLGGRVVYITGAASGNWEWWEFSGLRYWLCLC